MATAAVAAGDDWTRPPRSQSVTSLLALSRSACASPARSELSTTTSNFQRTPSNRSHYSQAGPFAPVAGGPAPVRRGRVVEKETVFNVQPVPVPRPQRPSSRGFLRRSASQNVFVPNDPLNASFRAASPFRGSFQSRPASPFLAPMGAPGAPSVQGAEGPGSGMGPQGRTFMVRSTSSSILQAATGAPAAGSGGSGGHTLGTGGHNASGDSTSTCSGTTGASGAVKTSLSPLGASKSGEDVSALRQGRGLLVRAATQLYKGRPAQQEGTQRTTEGTPQEAPPPQENARGASSTPEAGQEGAKYAPAPAGGPASRQARGEVDRGLESGEEAPGEGSTLLGWGRYARAHSSNHAGSRPVTAPGRRQLLGEEAPGMPGAGVPGPGPRRRPAQGEELQGVPGAPKASQLSSFGALMRAVEAMEGAQEPGVVSRGGGHEQRAPGVRQEFAQGAASMSPMSHPDARAARRPQDSALDSDVEPAQAPERARKAAQGVPSEAGGARPSKRQPATGAEGVLARPATAGPRPQGGSWLKLMRGPQPKLVAEEGTDGARAPAPNSKDFNPVLQTKVEGPEMTNSMSTNSTSTNNFNSMNRKHNELNGIDNSKSSGSNGSRGRARYGDERVGPGQGDRDRGESEASSECMAITSSSSNSSLVSVSHGSSSAASLGAGTPEAYPLRPQTSGGRRHKPGPQHDPIIRAPPDGIPPADQGPEARDQVQEPGLAKELVQGQGQGPKGKGGASANLRHMFQKVNFMAIKKKQDGASRDAQGHQGSTGPPITMDKPTETPYGTAARGPGAGPNTTGLSNKILHSTPASQPARPATAHGRLRSARGVPAANQGGMGAPDRRVRGQALDAESVLGPVVAAPVGAQRIAASRTAHGPEDAQAKAVGAAVAADDDVPAVLQQARQRPPGPSGAMPNSRAEHVSKQPGEEDEEEERPGETVAAAVLARAMANAALLRAEESRRRTAAAEHEQQEMGEGQGEGAGRRQREREGVSAKGAPVQATPSGALEAPRKLSFAEKLVKTLTSGAHSQRTPPLATFQPPPQVSDSEAMTPLTLPHAAMAEQRARQRAQGLPSARGPSGAPQRPPQQQATGEGAGGGAGPHPGCTRRPPSRGSGSGVGPQDRGEGAAGVAGAELEQGAPRGNRLLRSNTMHMQAKGVEDREQAVDAEGRDKKLVRAISVRLSQREAEEGATGTGEPRGRHAHPESTLGVPPGASDGATQGRAAWATRGVPSPETSGEEDGWASGGAPGNPIFNAGMWNGGERPRRRHPKAKKRSAKASGPHGTPGRSRDPSPTFNATDPAGTQSPGARPGPQARAHSQSPQTQEVLHPGSISPAQRFPSSASSVVTLGALGVSQGMVSPRAQQLGGGATGGAHGSGRRGVVGVGGEGEGGEEEEDSDEVNGGEGSATNRNLLSVQGLYRPTTPSANGIGTPVESPRVHPPALNPSLGVQNPRMSPARHGPQGMGYTTGAPQGGQAVGVSASSPRGPRPDVTSVFHLVPLPLSSVGVGAGGVSGMASPRVPAPWSSAKPPMTPLAGDGSTGSSSPFLTDSSFTNGFDAPGVYQDSSSEDPSQSSTSSGTPRRGGPKGGVPPAHTQAMVHAGAGAGVAAPPTAQEYSVLSPAETSEDGASRFNAPPPTAGPGQYPTRQVVVPVNTMRTSGNPPANPHMSPCTPRHTAGARHAQSARSPRLGRPSPYDWEGTEGEARGQIVVWTKEGAAAGAANVGHPSPAALGAPAVAPPKAPEAAPAQTTESKTQALADSFSAESANPALGADEKTAQALKLASELLLLASQPRAEATKGTPALTQAEQLRIAARLLMAASEGLDDTA